MRLKLSPCFNGPLVAPERKREDFPRLGQTLKTLDGDEAINFSEQRFQLRGYVEILLLTPIVGINFKDDSDHGCKLLQTYQSSYLDTTQVYRLACPYV